MPGPIAKDFKPLLLALQRANFNQTEAATAASVSRQNIQAAVKKGHIFLQTKAGKKWAEETGFKFVAVASPEIVNVTLKAQLKEMEKRLKESDQKAVSTEAVRELFELSHGAPRVPEWVNDRSIAKYNHGIPALDLSDIHYGEMVDPRQVFGVNKFDVRICEQRMQRTIDTTHMLLSTVLIDPKFPGFVLCLGGDNINGPQEVMHPELHLGGEPIMRQIVGISELLYGAIRKLIKIYGRVLVVGVAGNHGRNTRKSYAKFYAETNFDWLVYQILERWLRAEADMGQVFFLCPPSRDVTFKIAGHPYRMTHGDQFKAGDSIIGPLGAVTRGDKKKRAMASTLPTDQENYETLIVHHFHTSYMTRKLLMNGSMKGYDEYALSWNFEYEPPMQNLWLTHEKYGLNHFMPVLCDDPPASKAKADWASFPTRAVVSERMQRMDTWIGA